MNKKIDPLKIAGYVTMGLGAIISIVEGLINDKQNENFMKEEIQKAVAVAIEKKES